MSTPRKPLTLELTTTDSAANHQLCLMQLRAAGIPVAPRTTVLSARVTPAARESLQALARRWGTTPSRVLGSILAMLSESDTTAPTRDQVAALKAITAALGLPPETDAETIKSALAALVEAMAPPEPSNTDPLQAAPEPQPVDPFAATKLSRELAARGLTLAQFHAAKAAMPRTPSKKAPSK